MASLLHSIIKPFIRFESQATEIQRLPETSEQPIIYVIERESLSDRLAIDYFLQQQGLPSISEKRPDLPGYLYLHKRRPADLRKPLQTMFDRLNQDDHGDIQLVPVSIFWGRSAGKEKNSSLLKAIFSDRWTLTGRIQKFFTILINGRNTYVEVSKPISLRSMFDIEQVESRRARKLHRVLRVHFRRTRTAIIGPDLSHRRMLINSIVESAAVREAMNAEDGRDMDAKNKKARAYLREIAADVSYATVRVLDILLTWVWNKIYDGVKVNNIEVVREAAKDSEIVYVPCHRSHIDYLLLSYTMYYEGLTIPHIAAGNNLNMPIVGPILRRGGAFFMRRSFRGNKLYAAVFNEYLHQMLSRGHPIEYFVEGGRSRTGRMLPPKGGMLAMTLKSYLRDSNKPIKFVPVYIGYEKVFEEGSYLKELRGKKKKKESPLDLIRSLSKLKNFGQVSLNFGTPFDLGETLSTLSPQWKEDARMMDGKPSWFGDAVDRMSQLIAEGINDSAATNPVNLIGTALLASRNQALSEESLLYQVDLLRRISEQQPYHANCTFAIGDTAEWVESLVKRKIITKHEQPLGSLYSLDEHNAILQTYYRNNVIHLFAIPSLVAALTPTYESKSVDQLKQEIKKIYTFIRAELFMTLSEQALDEQIEHTLRVLTDAELMISNDQGVQQGSGSDQQAALQLLGNIVRPILERYFLTLSILTQKGNHQLSAAHLETLAQQMAQRLSVLNGLNAPEFFDKGLFKTFIATLKAEAVITTDDNGLIVYHQGLNNIMEEAEKLLNRQVVHNIHQVQLDQVEEA